VLWFLTKFNYYLKNQVCSGLIENIVREGTKPFAVVVKREERKRPTSELEHRMRFFISQVFSPNFLVVIDGLRSIMT